MHSEHREELLRILHRLTKVKKDQIKTLEVMLGNAHDEDISDADMAIAVKNMLIEFVKEQVSL